jgi:acyl dehydratase
MTLSDLAARIGVEHVSDWRVITQEMVDAHAALTGDADPFHNDVEWAKANTPWRGTIVQGFLLLGHFTWFIRNPPRTPLENVAFSMNYGFNRIRFVRPVLTGTPVRARIRLLDADERGDNAAVLRYSVAIESEAQESPHVVAEWLGFVQFKTGPG